MRYGENRRLGRAGLVPLLAVVLLATACTFGPVSTEQPVFTAEDASSPPWLSDTYAWTDPDNGRSLYVRTVETGAGRAVELLVPSEDETAKEGFPWTLWWFPAEFVALDDGYYGAHLRYEHRMKYMSGEPEFRHGYWVVAHDGETLRLLDVEGIDKEKRRQLAGARALEITDDGKLTGTLSRATLRGFLADLGRAAEDVPAVSNDGRKKDEKRLAKLSGLPEGVDIAGYDYLAAYHSLLPPESVSGDPDIGFYLAYLEALEARGVPHGAYVLARLYANGWGVAQDFGKARSLAQEAVAAGYERANTVLGVLAFNGLGEPVDTAGGLALLERGAAAGDPRAMLALSNLYLAGTAVEKNDATALAWLTKAADGGLPDAQFELGRRHLNGEGVAQDDAAAFKGFEGAAKLEHPDALAFLGFMYANGRGGVEANQETASQDYLKAARLGQGWAQWQIGERLIAGTGIEQDRAAGLDWLRKAAEGGVKEAKDALARLGEVPPDPAAGAGGANSGQQGKDIDGLAAEIDAGIEAADKEIAELEAELKELCGGRVCKQLADGRYIYRTETYDPPVWYFEDGRLAPRELWQE
ncbi:MAG: tetratricopeptide repeat protein [Alphaproteobacteria bacterium]